MGELCSIPELHYLDDESEFCSFPTPNADRGGVSLFSAFPMLKASHPSSRGSMRRPLSFDQNWKGENPEPRRATEVRLLWTPDTLFLRFLAHYQSLNLYEEARNDGWRDQLWDRDVAEVFLQPDSSDPLVYKEFEVATERILDRPRHFPRRNRKKCEVA